MMDLDKQVANSKTLVNSDVQLQDLGANHMHLYQGHMTIAYIKLPASDAAADIHQFYLRV